MSRKVGVLVIHGMGSQQPMFSAGLQREVSRRLGALHDRLAWQEIHWTDVLKDREDDLWACMARAREPDGSAVDLDWRRIRRFVVHNFGDATAYHRDWVAQSAYAAIHTVVHDNVVALKTSLADPGAAIVVMAHSLGGHIMSNYIWDGQHSTLPPFEPIQALAGMITFGCNIPLFSLAFPVATPINLPGTGVRKPAVRAAAKWLNFLDADDVLGWPVKPLYEKGLASLTAPQRRTVGLIEDHEINVGSLVTSWNPAAHQRYWTDNDFTRPVTDFFKDLIAAVDA